MKLAISRSTQRIAASGPTALIEPALANLELVADTYLVTDGGPPADDASVVLAEDAAPKGYTVALAVRGKDYVYDGAPPATLSNMKNPMRGCGPFVHDDPTLVAGMPKRIAGAGTISPSTTERS